MTKGSLGNLLTVQLEYTDAKQSLLQAAQKAPVGALGFEAEGSHEMTVQYPQSSRPCIINIIVIAARRTGCLRGQAVANLFAVRTGDSELFRNVADKFASTFSLDRIPNLILRLQHNVIRTELRNISISYSHISLVDVAHKLRLNSPNPVADAVANTIQDGAIDATLDHANGWMVSKETRDIYFTNEPQAAFNSRNAFCLNMHALRFPQNSHKENGSAENRRRTNRSSRRSLQSILPRRMKMSFNSHLLLSSCYLDNTLPCVCKTGLHRFDK
ncbi:hypothetical protein C5167_044952 [Papaver somniferum]|uniref:PCI domain-containing protein n=1 Tax=Papaver somniferum TaxID=3469 RepID=A0A4Y7L9L2_PAPSO|nr:hypothetical protein C5167_044952 [Papaver somniferum]